MESILRIVKDAMPAKAFNYKLLVESDAVSIDQNNIRECNHQIKHMREIFGLAQQTVLYLGRSTNLSSYLLEKLHHWRENSTNDPSSTKNEVRKMAATELLSRAWFGRVWTKSWFCRRKSGFNVDDAG
jgi:hypothetical protein